MIGRSVYPVENCVEKAAIGQLIWLFKNECSAEVMLPGKLGLYGDGLSILVGPEIESIEGIGCLCLGFVENLPEGYYVQVNEGVGLSGGHTCQGGIQLNSYGPSIVGRIAGR